jgi:hypothetical protein
MPIGDFLKGSVSPRKSRMPLPHQSRHTREIPRGLQRLLKAHRRNPSRQGDLLAVPFTRRPLFVQLDWKHSLQASNASPDS